jgi:predicted HTH domain antitoxin
MKAKDIKEDIKNEIVTLYVNDRMYIGRISEKLNMNIWTVKKILKEKNVIFRPSKRSNRITW